MRKYKIKHKFNRRTQREVFTIMMRKFIFWVKVKSVSDEDAEYAKYRAKEVLYYLESEE